MAKKNRVSAPAATATEMVTAIPVDGEKVLLDPGLIVADDNVRFKLDPLQIGSLAQSIATQGQMTPVEVEPMEDGSYRLTTGFYRLAAITKLNKQGQSLLISAIVRPLSGDPKERLIRQVAENMQREDMTPMDKARAIDKMFKAGISRQQIMLAFASRGGRDGAEMKPASNASINMLRSFLGFPENIQDMIAVGRLGVGGAYQLTKCSPDKWQEVLDRAEAARIKEVERDEADEAKYTKAVEAVEKLAEEEKKAGEEANKASEGLEDLQAKANAKTQEYGEALKAAALVPKGNKEAKTKADEHAKALKADAEAATTAHTKAQSEAAKLVEKADRAKTAALEARNKLAQARAEIPKTSGSAGKGKGDQLTAPSITKAATEVEQNLTVALTAKEIRGILDDMSLEGSYPRVQEIAVMFKKAFAGEWGDKDTAQRKLNRQLAIFTGEKKSK